jgi:hypothetical protein
MITCWFEKSFFVCHELWDFIVTYLIECVISENRGHSFLQIFHPVLLNTYTDIFISAITSHRHSRKTWYFVKLFINNKICQIKMWFRTKHWKFMKLYCTALMKTIIILTKKDSTQKFMLIHANKIYSLWKVFFF